MPMLRAYKTEINPTDIQKNIIKRTIGVCRFIYNMYVAFNDERYEKVEKFMGGNDFSKWLTNKFIPQNEDKAWI